MPHEQTIPNGDKPVAGQRRVTHWEGCYRDPGHHACALAEIARLKAIAAQLANIPNPLENQESLC